MNGELEIRTAQHADIDGIFSLWLQSMTYHERLDPLIFGFDRSKAEDGKKFFAERMNKESALCVVAVRKNRVLGYLLGEVKKRLPFQKLQDIGHIYDIVVTEDERRTGIGSLLFNKALDFFKTKGLKIIMLSVSDKNQSALYFYEKHGFQTYVHNMVRKLL